MVPVTLEDPSAFAHPTFEVLYAVASAYLPEALRLLKVPAEDIDDLVHDVVLVAYRGLGRYEPNAGPDGEQPDALRMLRGWLSAIAWRQVAKRRGKAYRRFELPHADTGSFSSSEIGDAPTTEQLALETQRRKILAGVVQRLRPERAKVLLMHTFLEMSVPDIASELGLNPNTVKSRISRARLDALAAVKRLSRDEQSVLEGSPLLLPFALDTWGGGPAPRSDGFRGSSRALAAGALGLLAVGVAIGVALTPRSPRVVQDSAVTAFEPTLMVTGAPVADVPAVVVLTSPSASSAPPSTPASASPVAREATSKTLARELVWITAAKHALYGGAGDLALAALHAHEREFPQGELAGERAFLEAQARTALSLPAK